jgi:hypothetical protein
MMSLNELTDDGIPFDDGSTLEWPDCDGTIRRLDPSGGCDEERRPGDEGYDEWRDLFVIDEVEVIYTAKFRTKLMLPRGRYDLRQELAIIEPPEDDCSQAIEGSVTIESAECNGRVIAP